MRKGMIGVTVLGLMVAVSGTAAGNDSAALATGIRRPPAPPSVKITGVSRTMPGTAPGSVGPYTGGALDVVVLVENTSASTAEGITVKLTNGRQMLEKTISVPPKSTQGVKLVDSAGLESSCAPRLYTVSLAGAAAEPGTRQARITPTCTFTSTVRDPWNLATPDHVEYVQKDHVYFTNGKIVGAPTCTKGVTFAGLMANRSKVSSPSLILQGKAGSVVRSQTSAAFPLAAGESKEVTATPVASSGPSDPTGQLDVQIVDWTKSLGAHLENQGVTITTARSCTLTYVLEAQASRS